MKKTKILFMGTPEFAVSTLEKLLEAKHNIVGVVTAPDKPAGRGQKLKPSEVKTISENRGLKVLQPENLKSKDFIKTIKDLSPDICVVVAFRKLPKEIWEIPKYGTFNLHASLLPNYRGAAPIHWAIINGETKTGVTTFYINEEIDAGRILLKEATPIFLEDNVETLYNRLKEIGATLSLKTVELIEEGGATPKKQELLEHYRPAPKLNKENSKIDWSKSIKDIHNQIRGLNPFPVAWTNLYLSKNICPIKIYTTTKEFTKHQYRIGQVLEEEKQLKIAVKDGFLLIKELQLPAKKRMTDRDFLNSVSINDNAFVK